ncbi:uncharacterized protein BDZ99DRAFT_204182 [Mytilinidion resinicola]|uniref:Uncharacterized protein n=1 Tax=Mytilinidion resinicola TaxID=574789 RepID=A0A6A6Y0Y7_9PEZI|nr:uncharacterized protein BDZ99DRAFT_204182 [Mytilinidion resinicola]KAF2802471.1 hypothetical protein BDZ99DRAFT_204182 [Mytilinidion resinicola]
MDLCNASYRQGSSILRLNRSHGSVWKTHIALRRFPMDSMRALVAFQRHRISQLSHPPRILQSQTSPAEDIRFGDKYPAFSGIAEHMAAIFKEDYLAGFFAGELPWALLWRVENWFRHFKC